MQQFVKKIKQITNFMKENKKNCEELQDIFLM